MDSKCLNCSEKCPHAERAQNAALGRMYATNEFISLQKKVDSGNLVEVVRCCDCVFWKPPYMIDEEGNEKPWDGNIRFCEESESGIYVAGKCKHRLNTAYHSTDMAFRKEDDYCSYAKIFDERKNDGQIC